MAFAMAYIDASPTIWLARLGSAERDDVILAAWLGGVLADVTSVTIGHPATIAPAIRSTTLISFQANQLSPRSPVAHQN